MPLARCLLEMANRTHPGKKRNQSREPGTQGVSSADTGKALGGLIGTFVPIHCAQVSLGLSTNQILSWKTGPGSPSFDRKTGPGSPSFDRKTGPGSLSFDRKTGPGSPSFDMPPGDPEGHFQAAFLTAGLAPWKDLGRVRHLQRVNLIGQWFSITYTVSDTAQSL